MAKLSIIVPVLNEEQNLKNLLEDYLGQSKKAHELILVDGGSKDGTIGIIRKAMKKDKSIRLLVCKKKGPSAARNMGIDKATGDYIMFIDADWRLLNKNTLKNILAYVKGDDFYFFTVRNMKTEFRGLRKYIYLKDKNTCFGIIRLEKCPQFDEDVGFGEDRLFYDRNIKRNKYVEIEVDDSEIPLSRAHGKMDGVKLLKRYMWYGRTMPNYLRKTKDLVQFAGYGVYIISIIPLLWVIPFMRGFLRGMRELKYGLDAPFGIGIVEIISAIGISLGFMQWVLGNKNIGRD